MQSGSKKLAYDKAEVNERYVAWAVMRQRSTGAKFFFADAHLEPGADTAGSHLFYDLRRKQAQDVVATIKAKNGSRLPTILVGDFNSHKFTVPSNGPYDIVTKAGYDDPLGNIYESTTNTWGATVEKRFRTYLNSFNGFKRVAPAHPNWVNGTNIDYILTTGLRVSEFETVAKLDSCRQLRRSHPLRSQHDPGHHLPELSVTAAARSSRRAEPASAWPSAGPPPVLQSARHRSG